MAGEHQPLAGGARLVADGDEGEGLGAAAEAAVGGRVLLWVVRWVCVGVG